MQIFLLMLKKSQIIFYKF